MNDQPEFDENSPAVRTHLSIMQQVIARMAAASRWCKTWGVIVIAAVLIGGEGLNGLDYPWIAYIPVALFLGLDMYYLALERRFRASYNTFLHKLREGNITAADLYKVVPEGSAFGYWLRTASSPSVWPFYLTLVGVITFAVWQAGQ